ncbi:solute carrier family 2, facilitated glucose transporter member 10-like [Bacillus rossius redtenbacheri]|uniref:solute carrier family 2, facilitated glucose transporter member 10-like n=1 Tax=Bacillus rossius redtenbacheri TaxID=93214 RepID=UPI002FDE0BDC
MSDEEDTSTLLGDKLDGRKVMDLAKPPPQVVKVDHSVNAVSTRNDVLLTALVAGFSGFCFGFDVGLCTHILPHVKNEFNLACSEEYVHTIVWLIGALLSSLLGGMVIDSCGRRCGMMFSTVVMVLGLLLTGVTHSYPVFLCGRLLSGAGGALSAVAQCVYAAEASRDSHRGRLVTGHQLGAAAGSLACGAGLLWGGLPWRAVLWMPLVPACVQAVAVATGLPESPHFRLLRMSQGGQARSSCRVPPSVLEVSALAAGLVLFQQLSGRFAVLDLARRLLTALGVCPEASATVTSVALGLVKVCAVCVSLSVVDRLGRRPVLLLGAVCMAVSLVATAVLSTLDMGPATAEGELSFAAGVPLAAPELPTGAPPPFPMLPTPLSLAVSSPQCRAAPLPLGLPPGAGYAALLALLCAEAAYCFSWWPVAWLLLAELFPAAVRGRSVAAAAALYWLLDVLVPPALPRLTDALSIQGTFLLHSMICLISLLFIFLFVPETKGKTFHQISQELKSTSSATRMFQNLRQLPGLRGNEWIRHRSAQYRPVSHAIAESAVI